MAHACYEKLYELLGLIVAFATAVPDGTQLSGSGLKKLKAVWLHAMVALLMIAEGADSSGITFPLEALQEHQNEAFEAMVDAGFLITDKYRLTELKQLEICSPSDIMASLFCSLTADITQNTVDICATYTDYLQKLVSFQPIIFSLSVLTI